MIRALWGSRPANKKVADNFQGFFTKDGVHRLIDGEDYISVAEGVTGCVIYGPYCMLSPGAYEVTFALKGPFVGEGHCGSVDVNAADLDKVIAKRPVSLPQLAAN